ncbi:MAG: EpsG family protein [Brumimicrobium sp.]
MIQSFLVYGLFAFLLWKFGKIAAKREEIYYDHGRKEVPFWTWEIFFSLLIFAVISGIRWQVGVDHLSYLEGYERVKDGLSFNRYGNTSEPGFLLVTNLFTYFNAHFAFYFAFWAFLQLLFIYYAVRFERYLLPFIGILIIFGPHYLSWMNGTRQMVAACMFVYAIQFIRDRKLVPYVITILLAATIHKSALVLLIFYFIPQKDYFKNRYINLVLVGLTFYIGMNPTWLGAVEFAEQMLAFLGYERYSERLDLIVEYRREMNIGPRRLSILFLNALIIWYAPKLKQVFKNTNYLIYFNFTFIGILLYNLFANTSHIFLRPVSYFTIFLLLTTAYLLYYLKPKEKYMVNMRFVIVFLTAISYMIFAILSEFSNTGIDYTNYKFFFLN